MRELIIYSQSDWKTGTLMGSYATDDNKLTNGMKTLGDEYFSNPILADYKEEIKSDAVDYKRKENNIRLDVNKATGRLYSEDIFCRVYTKLYDKDMQETEVDMVSIHFSWDAYKTQLEEIGSIKFKTKGAAEQEVIFTNRAQIRIKNFDGEKETIAIVDETGSNSIGNFASYVSNSLNNWYVDVILQYDYNSNSYKINTRLRGSGYQSKWYQFDFGPDKINELEFIQYANKNTNTPVEKRLNIQEIYIDGFHTGTTYKSRIFDSREDNSVWKTINLNGHFSFASLPHGTETNAMEIEIFADNNYENVAREENCSYKKVILLEKDFEDREFNYTLKLNEDEEEFKGRYMAIKIANSTSRFYQNNLHYIRIQYTPGSEVTEESYQEVTSAIVVENIDEKGGVIELGTESFNARLYIPPGALDGPETITIQRIASDEEVFADDMIGFKFKPEGLNFNKLCLLEVDYAGFKFGPYQSEDGFQLGYLKNNEPEQFIETIISKQHKKALSYINRL